MNRTSSGAGKTLFGVEFLVRGAAEYEEAGVLMAFEETGEELAQNVASLGFDLEALIARKMMVIDYVHVDHSEILETGQYNLEGLFVRLGHAIDSIGAKRVTLDSLETLFGGLTNTGILRAELRRLFRWLKDKGVTTVVTAERGDGTLTRYGIEEYVSDCVISLDHSVRDDITTRRLRIVKYRGSSHGTNEYPFLIDDTGITVLPVTSLGLEQTASLERISMGIPDLDEMITGGGFYRGTSILVSGTAGSGKSSIGIHAAAAACARGERALYVSFEESESQIVRNMSSIGLDLRPHVKDGSLKVHSTRATVYGLEMHLVTLYKMITEFDPSVVVIDPMTSLRAIGTQREATTALSRLVDFLKTSGRTGIFM